MSDRCDVLTASGLLSPTIAAAAGPVDVSLTNRNPWYRTVAREEPARLEGAGRDACLKVLGKAVLDGQVGIWRAMIAVLDSGEHCPHHFRGRKP